MLVAMRSSIFDSVYLCISVSLKFCNLDPALLQMANSSGMQNMFKKNLYMMDSMTDDELDGKVGSSMPGNAARKCLTHVK